MQFMGCISLSTQIWIIQRPLLVWFSGHTKILYHHLWLELLWYHFVILERSKGFWKAFLMCVELLWPLWVGVSLAKKFWYDFLLLLRSYPIPSLLKDTHWNSSKLFKFSCPLVTFERDFLKSLHRPFSLPFSFPTSWILSTSSNLSFKTCSFSSFHLYNFCWEFQPLF